MEHVFSCRPSGNFREQWVSETVGPVFPERIFQAEIRVPFVKIHLWHRFFVERLFFVKRNKFLQMVVTIPE